MFFVFCFFYFLRSERNPVREYLKGQASLSGIFLRKKQGVLSNNKRADKKNLITHPSQTGECSLHSQTGWLGETVSDT